MLHETPTPAPVRSSLAARRLRAAGVAAATVLLLTGCSSEVRRGWLPGNSDAEITDHTGRVVNLWVGSWIAALAVGVVTWGLMIWCVAAYRRRKDETGLPSQLRYNVPAEVLFTVLPLFMVAVLFFYTARDQQVLESREAEPDHTVQVIGKQWSWDFNYVDEDVFESGKQVDLESTRATSSIPELVFPVGETVRLELNARDVIHSFWVPAFLYKKDMIPGRTNLYQFTPQETGMYVGKCAELCGQYHSEMLFNVRVVERPEYDSYITALRAAGQVGQLGLGLSRVDTDQGDNQVEDTQGGSGTEGENG